MAALASLATGSGSSGPLQPMPLQYSLVAPVSLAPQTHYYISPPPPQPLLDPVAAADDRVAFVQQARALQEADRASVIEACTHCGTLVCASAMEDHSQLCLFAPVRCFLCGLAGLTRDELWPAHLSAGQCLGYIVPCSSFACARSADTMVWTPRTSTEQTLKAAQRMRLSNEHNMLHYPAMMLERETCMSGCDLIGAPGRNSRQDHSHYHAARAELEQRRFFLPLGSSVQPAPASHASGTEEEQKQGSSMPLPAASQSSPASSAPTRHAAVPPTVRLSSCPHCLQRLCVSLDESFDSSAAHEASSPTQPQAPIPYNDDTFRSYARARVTPASQRKQWRKQLESKLVCTPQEECDHVAECARRVQQRASWLEGALEAAASLSHTANDDTSAPSARMLRINPSLLTLQQFRTQAPQPGVLAWQPLFPSVDLSLPPVPLAFRVPVRLCAMAQARRAAAGPAYAGAQGTAARAAALVCEPVRPAGVPTLLMSHSHLLGQLCLLELAYRLDQGTRGLFHFAPKSQDAALRSIAESIFASGGSISELLSMYDAQGELLAGVQKMYAGQKSTIDTQAVMNALAPMQRPLVEPLLVPFLIKDLANIVLEYF